MVFCVRIHAGRRCRAWRLATVAVLSLVALSLGATATPQTVFPLKVERSGRYLVDQSGAPFFVNGDTPWSLTHNLTYAEAVQYMEDRRKKGINALIVSVPDAYGQNGVASYPPDRQGQQPFVGEDITKLNEPYWQHVDSVLAKAEEMGFLVLYWPFYLGCCDDGYMALFQQNGATKAKEYGRIIGKRYGGHRNLIWVHGGDHDPEPVSALVTAVKAGIQEVGPTRLHATHWSPERDPYSPYGAAFTDLYTTYTYGPVATLVSRHYNHSPTKPVLLLETHYENDWAGKPGTEVRKYPYRAVLSGAAGHFFGNKPIWYCGFDWQVALNSTGSRAMEYVGNLFASRPWQLLVPATTLVTSGGGDPLTDTGVQAALASDKSFALAFLNTSQTIQVALGQISGSTVRAWWFDIATGVASLDGTYAASGSRSFIPPQAGSYVLVLDDASRGFPAPGLSVKGIAPVSGPVAGGTPVTIKGAGFTTGTGVAFSGVAATGVNVVSSTTLTAVTPPHPTGLVDVSVTTPAPQTATLPQAFFYAPTAAPADFFTVAPCRVLDTRATSPLAPQERRVVPVAGYCGVPSSAAAVALNVTVTGTTAAGYLIIAPGNGLSSASALNFAAGQTRGNNGVARLATDATGSLSVKNGSSGSTHVIIDVSGYFE